MKCRCGEVELPENTRRDPYDKRVAHWCTVRRGDVVHAERMCYTCNWTCKFGTEDVAP
jgi:hypothetical protein